MRVVKLLSNQKCMTQPSLINLHPTEYSREFHYYSFAVKSDRCVEILLMTYLVNYVFQINLKDKDLNRSVFNMITAINETKTLTKHISWKWKWKFHGRKCNSNQCWNHNKCVKNIIYAIKFGILLHVVAKMENI